MATRYSAIRDSAPRVTPSSRKFPMYRRWWWQFEALTFKNGALFGARRYCRRLYAPPALPSALIRASLVRMHSLPVRKWGAAAIFVLAPTLFILFLWLLHQSVVSGGSSSSAAGHAHFGKCKTYNVYWEEADFPCTTLAYAPVGGRYDDIMRRVATKTELACVSARGRDALRAGDARARGRRERGAGSARMSSATPPWRRCCWPRRRTRRGASSIPRCCSTRASRWTCL